MVKVNTPPPAGHDSHTQAADAKGLPGKFDRPVKVVFLGAGSHFTKSVGLDLFQVPGNAGGEIALVDIDSRRLSLSKELLEMVAARYGDGLWKISATTAREEALPDADYIVNCIEVNGGPCVRPEYDIPLKYGLDQCIGDTIGPGGLFKALRTIPTWVEVLADVEEHCPDAIVLNYTNPMVMMCLAAGWSSDVSTVGLCHSVQGTSHLLAKRAEVPYEEINWECAGINHLAWFTRFEHQGRDLYPILFEKAIKDLAGEGEDLDLVRKDMMLHFGAFITESSGHLSEYLPYYRKRKDLLERYARPSYDGESGFYANNWPKWREERDEERRQMIAGTKPIGDKRSWEYASWIIEAREKGVPYTFHGNVMNSLGGGDTLISNLSPSGCVEVKCVVDRNGFQPVRYGALPPQMAALCESNLRMFELGTMAALERSVDAAIHALMIDPLTAAVCSPAEIQEMALEMFEAEKEFLPGFDL